MARFALLLAALTACAKDNPYYCDEQCQMQPDGGGGSASACTSSDDCSGTTPVCDTTQSTCVACTATDVGACAGTTPVCVAATNTCAPCATHAECSSEACLPTGECGTDANVAYVGTGGADTGTCTHDDPCATLTYAASQRGFVKLQDDITEEVTLASRNVTVMGDGTTVIRNTNGSPVIAISGTSDVTLRDLVIRDATSSLGHGISVQNGASGVTLTLEGVAILNNGGNGLSFLSGVLHMTRSVVSGNQSGGAKIDATFDITNSLFVENGNGTVTLGGLSLTPGIGTNVFAFNTVAANHSSSGSITYRGINCAAPLTLTNTIVSGNAASANCTFEYSLFDTGTVVTGSNKAGNPQFKNIDATMPLAADYFRIANNSDAIDGAAPSSTVMTDIDGDDRPQGGVRDIGADEYK